MNGALGFNQSFCETVRRGDDEIIFCEVKFFDGRRHEMEKIASTRGWTGSSLRLNGFSSLEHTPSTEGKIVANWIQGVEGSKRFGDL